ncbi:MAG: TetR/AcrR family transcriptional regulator, partial [Vicinamibacterales bacterium]
DETLSIVKQDGVGAVSIREVARRAQVSHAAPAHHFGSKSGLLTACAVVGFRKLTAVVDAAADGAATNRDALQATGVAYVQFAIDNPELFTIMFSGQLVTDDPAYTEALSGSYRRLQQVLGAAAAAGELRGDPRLVGVAAWSLVHGLAALWLSGRFRGRGEGRAERRALIEAVTALFAGGVFDAPRGA